MQTDIQTVTITGYGSGGEGVARLTDGRVAFIPGAARGDVCDIELVEEAKRFARGNIVRIVEPSPHRIEPGCDVYPDCGGCDFRHISYEEELWAKLLRVNDALARIGGVNAQAEEILSTGRIDGYRNRAVPHSANGNTGFYRKKSHEVIPVNNCRLLSDEAITVGERSYELDGLTFHISPGAFFQVNTEAALLLFQKAREYAALRPDETLLDLYCGVGAMTLFLGRDAGNAVGVDIIPASIENARENALRNGMNHAEFICADATAWDADGLKPDCIVVDPPRKGLSAGAVQKILELSPTRVVYVSCDPATLARDIKLLTGYTALRVSAIDMFPRTANVECVALLTRLDT